MNNSPLRVNLWQHFAKFELIYKGETKDMHRRD